MQGQWIGEYTGTNTGKITVNIDEFPSHFAGVAYISDNNPLLPGTAIGFKTKDKKNPSNVEITAILPIDPKTVLISSWEQVKQLFGHNVILPTSGTASASWDQDFLKLSWVTNIGTKGSCILPRSEADKPSELVAAENNWEGYKKYVATLEGRNYLFRGQNQPWRLRTAFHRTGRADLHRFLNEDIQVLHKHLSARTKHLFNLSIPDENGAFLNLVQHHGYPTPLLDWSYSPYVAAFFAYRNISNQQASKASPSAKVRIHVLDQLQWKTDWRQVTMLLTTAPHLSLQEFIAIENERLIPQQSASTVTNLDDIETYIKLKESNGKIYLSAIDLPVQDRKKVIQELSYMGITAASLFPGLDGACEELRERFFQI